MRTALCAVILCTLSAYAGTEIKAKPSDYPASAEASGGTWIGADFGGHTFSAENTSFLVEDYICIEVAVFPPPGGKDILVSATHFALRLNKHKAILAQSPGMVAASMKYPDWTQKPTMEAQAGPMVIGPRPQSRFPGDPTDRRNRLPGPASTDPAADAERKPVANPVELIPKVALDEGMVHVPRSGYLYFPYGGKLGKLNSIELVYSGGGSSTAPVTVKLR